jgi:hypothetical protein
MRPPSSAEVRFKRAAARPTFAMKPLSTALFGGGTVVQNPEVIWPLSFIKSL